MKKRIGISVLCSPWQSHQESVNYVELAKFYYSTTDLELL